jgi:hypothetical protein
MQLTKKCFQLKHIIVFTAACFCVNTIKAQAAGEEVKNSIIKINVPALFLKNISLQYEIKTSTKSSFAVAVRYRPKSSVPFKSAIEDLIDQPAIRVDLFKMGNIGITPEYRFYLSRKKNMQGFYIAPFISYNHYTADIPINYDSLTKEKTAVFNGSTNSWTFGFQLGAQWKINNNLTLDWWILGPNYGVMKGNFITNNTLNDDEQTNMFYQLFKITEGINPKIIESFDVKTNGTSFKVNGPWGGIRAMGINLGYRF